MSSGSPPRARPLPLRDAAGRVVDSTRAAAALGNFGSESTKVGGGGGGRRASSTTSVMASSVGGGGGISFDLRSSPSSSSPSSSSFSALSLLVRRLLSTPLAPCLAYGAISICITLFNKAVFSVYKFQFPAFVTALQVVLSIVYIVALSRAGALDLNGGNKNKDKDKVDEDEDEEASAAAAGDGGDTRTTRSRSSPPPFRFSRATARAVAPMALLWFGYVASGVAALRYLNVPMYSVLRRATTPLVALGEFLALHKKPSAPRAAALAAMLVGALLASATDLTFSLPGYLWAGACVACTAAYLVLIRATGDSTGLGPFALQLYNNALAVPLVAAWLLASRVEVFRTVPVGVGAGGGEMTGGGGGGSGGGGGFSLWGLLGLGRRRASADPLDPTAILPTATAAVTSVSHVSELAAALASPLLRDPRFVAFLVLSASQAFLLNAAIFWCTTANSPLATSVTGQLKDAATTAAGLVLFGDVAFGFGNLAGVALSLAGGIGYAAVAHAEGKREQQAGRQREQQQQQQQRRRKAAAAAAAAAVSQKDRI